MEDWIDFSKKTIYSITTSPQAMHEDTDIECNLWRWLESNGVKLIKGGYGNSDLSVAYTLGVGVLEKESWFDIEEVSPLNYINIIYNNKL